MPDWVIQWWATALFGGIVGALSMAVKSLRAKQKEQQTRQGTIEEGIKAILHSELYRECGECEKKGYAAVDDLRNIEYLYAPYHALGGNGTGTLLYERVKQLPSEPAEREVV
jgi:hypothetical protein